MLLLSLPHSPPFLDSNQDVLTGALLALSIYGLLAFPDVLAPLNRLFDRVVATPNFLLNDKTRSPLPSKLQWKLGLIAIASLIFCYFSPYLNDYLDNLVVLRYPSLGTKLFYSTKSIAEGATITQSAMEEREVLGYRHPVIYFEGIPSKEELEGRVAYRQLSPGERLTYQNTSKEEAVVYALTDIPAGKVISADTIGVKKIIDRNVRAGTILSTEGVCGRTTKSGIAAGRILTCDDLLPKDSAPPIEIKPGPIEANYLGELQSKKL
jgi:flagella basal body P-ring formation protein FlgA